jgi:lipopolysaccharide/colanic/teichoic acid biosynthesis glycosyltransferase
MISKRVFDFLLSLVLSIILLIPLTIFWLILSLYLGSNGVFFQTRIGQFGKSFTIYKFKTFLDNKKVSRLGIILRKTKIDELPQLFNILKGDMSFVGPRPDIPGYYDLLEGESRKLLKLKPGITSEASLKYINEEQMLVLQQFPQKYNDDIIFLDKIKLNLHYYYNRNFILDLKIIFKTIKLLIK